MDNIKIWNTTPNYLELEGQNVSKLIANKIYVSGADFADDRYNLDELGIKYVISITYSALRGPQYHTHSGIQYHRITGVEDSPTASLSKHIKGAIDFFKQTGNGPVLIHCQMGVSRSPSIAIACLMYMDKNLDLRGAYEMVKSARPHIAPQHEFLFQIKEYLRYRLEAMILKDSIIYEFYNPERTQASLWIVDWYYNNFQKRFTDPFGLYQRSGMVWRYKTDGNPTFLYDIENL